MLFLYFGKRYDRAQRHILWEILQNCKIPNNLLYALESLYTNILIKIKLDHDRTTESRTYTKL